MYFCRVPRIAYSLFARRFTRSLQTTVSLPRTALPLRRMASSTPRDAPRVLSVVPADNKDTRWIGLYKIDYVDEGGKARVCYVHPPFTHLVPSVRVA